MLFCFQSIPDWWASKHFLAGKLTGIKIIYSNPLHNQCTRRNTYPWRHIYSKHRNTQLHSFSTCGKDQVHKPAEKSFSRQASEAIPLQQGGKKTFFNGEKWESGEELAVAAKIIDGNCLGTRLRFMGRTTHGGWEAVCTGSMKDMRQHFD